ALLLAACGSEPSESPPARPASVQADADDGLADAERVLGNNLDRILAYADSIESALRPVPLLTPAQGRAFDRYNNAAQLEAARRLGVPQPVSNELRDRLLTEGRLVRLEDSEYSAVRDLDHSTALVTPDVVALLEE